jgi:hypothetical protein
MAELKGPIQFIGSIGNIRVYYNKTLKRYIVSTKGGSIKDLIKKNPAYARQRENMSEFKVCAYWSSLLRHLLESIDHLAYGYYFSGFMKLAKAIQKQDTLHQKGFRSVESSKAANLLTTLCFNKEHPFEEVFSQRFDVAFSGDRKTVTLTLPGFISRYQIMWPTRFQLYRLALVIAELPDFGWDETEKRFMPCVDGLERRTAKVFTEWKQQSTEAEDVVLTTSFAEPALSVPGTTVIVALGIELSPGIGELTSTSIAGMGTMKIVDCFV